MAASPLFHDERARIEALERYAILDTSPEDAFDELARLASAICGTPVALISLVDSTRQWFKARVGIEVTETPRAISFCAHAIEETDLFVVPDATKDARFAQNPLVVGDPKIRFYAGAQLTTPEGLNLGTLCVIDDKPRVIGDEQRAALVAIARQVIVQLELRRQIAERIATEEKLRRSEAQLQRVLDGSNDGFWDWNIATGEVQYSKRFAELLGYELSELEPRISTMEAMIHPDDRFAVRRELARQLDGESDQYASEHRMRRKDGSWMWLFARGKVVERDERGRPVRMAGMHTDITDTKIAHEALRRSEARTRSIIDNALGGIITADANGVIESANASAARMFGYHAHELIGRDIGAVITGEEELAPFIERSLGRIADILGHRRDGSTFPCELSLFEFDGGDERRHIAAHLLDVSERHEVDRMKKAFVSTVSHELRTPLTSIRGSLGLLASGVMGELTPDARQLVAVAERNSVRLISLINAILDFEKLESGKAEMELRPVPLQRLLEQSLEAVSPTAAQEAVRIECERTGAIVMADETRVTQVMVHLLTNAVKYSHSGDAVTIRTRQLAGQVEVQVVDRGRGIPSGKQKKIFDRFHQLDSSDARASSGTGLGLAICKLIIEQHHGTIGVDSAEGEGSTFWFRIGDGAGTLSADGSATRGTPRLAHDKSTDHR
ncbi:MAG TPA: PAS domain S-box protein [Thermoanaerobaculia bacterium]|jgi:PAS domain S-box-containing protein